MRLQRDKRSQRAANELRTPGIRHTLRDTGMRSDGCRTPAVAVIGLRQTSKVKVYPPRNTNERVHAVEKNSIHMLQDDLAAMLEEVLRLQEEFRKMTNAQNAEKQKEKRMQEKTDIPGIKHTEEFRTPRITPINFRWLDTMNGLQGSIHFGTEPNEWNEKQNAFSSR